MELSPAFKSNGMTNGISKYHFECLFPETISGDNFYISQGPVRKQISHQREFNMKTFDAGSREPKRQTGSIIECHTMVTICPGSGVHPRMEKQEREVTSVRA